MAYATEADLDAGWDRNTVDLNTLDPVTNARDHARIATALDAASAVIDSYVGRRHPLPVALAPGGRLVLAQYCADLALARLASSTAGTLTDAIKDRQAAAITFLRDVAAAKADLALLPDPALGQPAGVAEITPNEAVLVGQPRRFSRDALRDL